MKNLFIFFLICFSVSMYAQNIDDYFLIGAYDSTDPVVLDLIHNAHYNCMEVVNFNHESTVTTFPQVFY